VLIDLYRAVLDSDDHTLHCLVAGHVRCTVIGWSCTVAYCCYCAVIVGSLVIRPSELLAGCEVYILSSVCSVTGEFGWLVDF
jgi:hypothetical protein